MGGRVCQFLQYYRESANWLERTYAWVPRVGIKRIRAVVVDDVDGIAGRLDAEMAKAVAAHVDPWREAAAPATNGQLGTAWAWLPTRPCWRTAAARSRRGHAEAA